MQLQLYSPPSIHHLPSTQWRRQPPCLVIPFRSLVFLPLPLEARTVGCVFGILMTCVPELSITYIYFLTREIYHILLFITLFESTFFPLTS